MEKSILIIDDEKEIGILLEDAIQLEDVVIHQIYNGKDALEYLDKHKPDLVFLDIQLPEINGMEILQYIRTKDNQIRVVMITAFASVETAVNALKSGADDYLCKPFTIKDLREVVDQYLENEQTGESRLITLEEVEKKHIATVLQANDGNRRKTAEDLGISLRTLYYKIKQYDLM